MSVASDEILLQLLKTPSQRKRILALSTLVDDPRFSSVSQDAKKISKRAGSNIEQILALKPDLVIAASFNQGDFLNLLRGLKIKVHVMEGFQSLDDLKRHILDIGTLIDTKEEAQAMIKGLVSDLKSLEEKQKIKILPLFADRTLIGKNTLLDDLLLNAGYTNLASVEGLSGWQKMTEERLLNLSPDWILTSAEENERDQVLSTLSQSPALRAMKAFKEKKILLIPPALFSSFSKNSVEILKLMKKQRA